MTRSEWKDMSEEIYQELFKRSAVKRSKFSGLKRNLDFLND